LDVTGFLNLKILKLNSIKIKVKNNLYNKATIKNSGEERERKRTTSKNLFSFFYYSKISFNFVN